MGQKVNFPNNIFEECTNTSDHKLIYTLKDMIGEAIVENCVYYDSDDIEIAIEVIYPIVFSTVFNTNFNLRHDKKAINNLITYLVTNLA